MDGIAKHCEGLNTGIRMRHVQSNPTTSGKIVTMPGQLTIACTQRLHLPIKLSCPRDFDFTVDRSAMLQQWTTFSRNSACGAQPMGGSVITKYTGTRWNSNYDPTAIQVAAVRNPRCSSDMREHCCMRQATTVSCRTNTDG